MASIFLKSMIVLLIVGQIQKTLSFNYLRTDSEQTSILETLENFGVGNDESENPEFENFGNRKRRSHEDEHDDHHSLKNDDHDKDDHNLDQSHDQVPPLKCPCGAIDMNSLYLSLDPKAQQFNVKSYPCGQKNCSDPIVSVDDDFNDINWDSFCPFDQEQQFGFNSGFGLGDNFFGDFSNTNSFFGNDFGDGHFDDPFGDGDFCDISQKLINGMYSTMGVTQSAISNSLKNLMGQATTGKNAAAAPTDKDCCNCCDFDCLAQTPKPTKPHSSAHAHDHDHEDEHSDHHDDKEKSDSHTIDPIKKPATEICCDCDPDCECDCDCDCLTEPPKIPKPPPPAHGHDHDDKHSDPHEDKHSDSHEEKHSDPHDHEDKHSDPHEDKHTDPDDTELHPEKANPPPAATPVDQHDVPDKHDIIKTDLHELKTDVHPELAAPVSLPPKAPSPPLAPKPPSPPLAPKPPSSPHAPPVDDHDKHDHHDDKPAPPPSDIPSENGGIKKKK